MHSFMIFLLLVLLPSTSTTPSSVHHRLKDRHQDDLDEHDTDNPPGGPPVFTFAPSASPTASPTTSPTTSPTVSSSSTDIFGVNDDETECTSTIDGSFGEIIGDLDEYVVSYSYEMDTAINVVGADVLGLLEVEITNLFIQYVNPDCADPGTNNPTARTPFQSGITVSGISTGQTGILNAIGCRLSSEDTGECYAGAGQLSIFAIAGSRRRFLSDEPDVTVTAKLIMKDAMDSGELKEKVDGITRLAWVDDVVMTAQDRPIDGPSNTGGTNYEVIIFMSSASGALLLVAYILHRHQNRPPIARSSEGLSDSEDYNIQTA